MAKNNQLRNLMAEDLPNRTSQKRLRYRTNHREVLALFKLINKEVFSNKLPTPKIEIMPNCRQYWGMCIAKSMILHEDHSKSNCVIRLMDKWYCRQWLITTLAHEMCHQYQWDILGYKRIKEGKNPLMSHGPSFFIYREKLEKHGIPLKKALGMRSWFKHQNMFKC